nr:hypothetical protein [Roseovarius autotrophicus]
MIGQQVADRAVRLVDERATGERQERAPAPGAIGICGDDEQVFVGQRASPIGQIADASCVGVDHCAAQAVTGGRGQVDGVAQPVYHVEDMAGNGRIKQRLTGCARRDPVEADRRAFEPVAQVGPGHDKAAQGVGKAVEIGNVSQPQRPRRDVGEMIRAAAPAGLEGRAGREHRQRGIWCVADRLCQCCALRGIDKGEAGIVAHQRQIAVEGRARLAQGVAGQAKRVGMGAGKGAGDGPAGWYLRARAQRDGMSGHTPARGVTQKVEVDLAQVRGGIARLDARHPVQRAARHIGAWCPRVIWAWKDAVAVPGNDRVDPRHTRQCARRVLHARAVGAGVDAGMGQRDHDVRAPRTQRGHPVAGGFDDVACADSTGQMGVVPDHHLWRAEPDKANADRMTGVVGGPEVAREDRDRRPERGVI